MLTSRCPHCNSALGGGCTCVRGEYRMQEPEAPTFFSNKAFNTVTQICNAAEAASKKWKYSYVHDMYFKDLSREAFEKLITKFTLVDFKKLRLLRDVEMIPYGNGYIKAQNQIGLWNDKLEIFGIDANPKLYTSYERACLDLLEVYMSKRRSLIKRKRKVEKKIIVLGKEIARLNEQKETDLS